MLYHPNLEMKVGIDNSFTILRTNANNRSAQNATMPSDLHA